MLNRLFGKYEDTKTREVKSHREYAFCTEDGIGPFARKSPILILGPLSNHKEKNIPPKSEETVLSELITRIDGLQDRLEDTLGLLDATARPMPIFLPVDDEPTTETKFIPAPSKKGLFASSEAKSSTLARMKKICDKQRMLIDKAELVRAGAARPLG